MHVAKAISSIFYTTYSGERQWGHRDGLRMGLHGTVLVGCIGTA